MRNSGRIAITGIGPLAAGGSGKEEVWQSVIDKKTGLVQKEYSLDGETLGKFYVHEIADFDINRYGLDGNILREIKSWKAGDEIIDLYYFLVTVKMALDDSGIKIGEGSDSTGLVLAHENIGMDHFYWKIVSEMGAKDGPKTKKAFFKLFYEKFKRTGYELQTFMPLYHVAKVLDVHGYSLFLNNACASGLYALEAASDVIRSGKCDRMIVSAVDRSSIFKQAWFGDINILAKDGRIKPFARGRDGFTIGDGGAAIVMEDMEGAEKRKARIYAEYIGGSFVLEGWKVTYPDISGDRYEEMIISAIEKLGISTSDIDLVVPHGIGTSVTDEYEARAISKVFGVKKNRPCITALKPYIGHTLGSSALLETAIMLMAMEKGVIPETLNCENPDEKLQIDVLTSTKKDADINIAMKTACGFAGFDGACVFKRYR